jgi:hypothetical protein
MENSVSKPLSGRSLLQEGNYDDRSIITVCLQTAKRSFTFARWQKWALEFMENSVSKPLSGRSLLQGG